MIIIKNFFYKLIYDYNNNDWTVGTNISNENHRNSTWTIIHVMLSSSITIFNFYKRKQHVNTVQWLTKMVKKYLAQKIFIRCNIH